MISARSDRASHRERAVEDEVGGCAQQQSILGAHRLSLATVDDQDRRAARASDRGELERERKSAAAATAQP